MVTLPQNNYTQAFQAVLTMYIYCKCYHGRNCACRKILHTVWQYANAQTYKKHCYYNQVVTFRYLSNLVVEVLCTAFLLFL